MANAILDLLAAALLIYVSIAVTAHTNSAAVMAKIAPAILAIPLAFFAIARLMGWPV